MDSSRTILHADANGFYASVECSLNPDLKNVPMAVGGDEESRHGIILAKNELAKKYNIVTAETLHSARKKCPGLVIVSPHHDLYHQYSKRIFEIYKRYTDLVESFGLDEAWLDVTASRRLFGDGKKIADELREVVKKETGLTISVGVSFCKVFAKLGSDFKKPDATTVFDADNWRDYIYPMPVSSLLYVGKSTNAALAKMNIKTIGELSTIRKETLVKMLGKQGEMLYIYANGLDNAPVKSIYEKDEIKSVSKGMTFAEDIKGERDIKQGIYSLADSVGARMRAKGVKGSTVQVQIRNPDFKTIQRQRKLEHPTYLSKEIRAAAMEIVKDCWSMESPIRMMSVGLSNIVGENEVTEQMSLFDESPEKRIKAEKLEKTLDSLKNKFGVETVSLGSVGDIKNKRGH